MPGVWLDIIVIVSLIVLNGFFALAELAVVSSRKSRLQHLANQKVAGANTAVQLSENPGRFLSSVQVGITLVGILAGAFGGATLSGVLANALADVPLLAPYRVTISFIIVVLLISYVTLIIGELVPKRVALNNPERFAVLVSRPMSLLARIMSPLVAFLDISSDLVLRLFRIPSRRQMTISDEEVAMLFEEGVNAGVFEHAEKEIVERLFRLSDRRVNSLMTPRGDIVWLDVRAEQSEIVDTVSSHDFTALPVCDGSLDTVVGVVLAQDIVKVALAGGPFALRDLLRKPLILYEGYRALRAIEQLKQSGTHLAIIINEYGETEGLLTLTDVFESLVGEIPSTEEPEVIRREDGSLLLDGLLPIDEVKALLAVAELPREDERYQTLAGFIIAFLDRIPRAGDYFEWDGFRIEVLDMDGNRVDRVLITQIPMPSENEE